MKNQKAFHMPFVDSKIQKSCQYLSLIIPRYGERMKTKILLISFDFVPCSAGDCFDRQKGSKCFHLSVQCKRVFYRFCLIDCLKTNYNQIIDLKIFGG